MKKSSTTLLKSIRLLHYTHNSIQKYICKFMLRTIYELIFFYIYIFLLVFSSLKLYMYCLRLKKLKNESM